MLGLLDDQHLPDVIEEIRNACKSSIFHTARYLCDFKDVTVRTHYPIVKALESDVKRKLICVPRGTLKSSIASVAYPIWLLLNNPNLRILIDTEIYSNSITYLREIKNVMSSERFVSIYGNLKSNNWNEGEITLSTRTKTFKEASITCGAIGTTKVGQHYDLIIADDYSSNRNSGTPEQRKKVIDHYKYNMSILEPDGAFVVIGTRYHENDIIGHIIKSLGFNNEIDMKQRLVKQKGVYWYD